MERNRKSRFWTFIFSCYPGGGHMYLGFMKQGIQLMGIFTLLTAIAAIVPILRFTTFFMPILVAYSIFDAGNKRSNAIEPNNDDLELFKILNLNNTAKDVDINYYKIGAYVLIFLGGYMLFDNVIFSVLRRISHEVLSGLNIDIYFIEKVIKSTILGLIFIFGGFKLLGKFNKLSQTERKDDNV